MDWWILGALVALNIFQLIFWGFQVQRLVNKLMSRSYAEYDLVKRGPAPAQEFKQDPESADEHDVLKELNGMIGG